MQVAENARNRLVNAIKVVESELDKSEYLAGQSFSGADITLVGGLRGALVVLSHLL